MSSLIAALRAALSLDTVQFESGAKKARRTANTTAASINKSLGSIKSFGAGFFGAFTVGALSAGVKAALDYAGSLGEVSQQLGVTTRDLQVLRYAAGQVGVSQEQLETGLQKLTITLGKLAAGAKAPRAALEGIRKGMADQVLQAKDTGEAFRIIADGLAQIPDRAQRAAVEVALFGKSGANLDNLLSGGSAAINSLAQAAEELGIVLSEEQIRKADDTADKLEAVKTVLAANIAGVVADNAQSIVGLAQSLASLTAQIVKFLDSNPQLALALIGALAGGRIGGLPGAAIGAIAGVEVGGRLAANRTPTLGKDDVPLLRRTTQNAADQIRAKRKAGQPIKQSEVDRLNRLTAKLNSANGVVPSVSTASGNQIGNFLAGGGGGSSKKKDNSAAEAERARKEALRDAFDFAQDQRMADLDIIRAKQDLAVNLDEQTQLALEALDKEYEGQVARIQLNKELGDITDAQAEILIAKEDTLKATREEAILADRAAQQLEDAERLSETQFNIRRDELSALLNLAQSSEQRRRIALQLLELDYEEKRLALQRIVDNKKLSDAVRARAQAELDALPNQKALDRQGVLQATAGPMEQARADFSDLTDEMENLKVNGIMAVGDALATLATEGFGSFKDAAISAIKAIIAEFIRLQTIKFLFSMMGGMGGGAGAGAGLGGAGGLGSLYSGIDPMFLGGFATGGSFTIGGRGGMDRNLMSINGLPVANVSRGERVSIEKNGASSMARPIGLTQNFYGSVSRETAMQAGAKARQGIASANRKGA